MPVEAVLNPMKNEDLDWTPASGNDVQDKFCFLCSLSEKELARARKVRGSAIYISENTCVEQDSQASHYPIMLSMPQASLHHALAKLP